MQVIRITKCEECPYCTMMDHMDKHVCFTLGVDRKSLLDAIITDPGKIKPN